MTGLARIGEEVEDQFEPWALIIREKHFEGKVREKAETERRREKKWP